jgi:hypothetical protein
MCYTQIGDETGVKLGLKRGCDFRGNSTNWVGVLVVQSHSLVSLRNGFDSICAPTKITNCSFYSFSSFKKIY